MSKYYLVPDGIDGKFSLWNGPIENESNFHYAKFYGFNKANKEIWIYERTEISEFASIISEELAKYIILTHWHKYYKLVIKNG